MKWKIRSNSPSQVVTFRGKGGLTRSMRKDELVISNTEKETIENPESVACGEVIGRKAWRTSDEGKSMIENLVTKLNEDEMTPLQVLESIERHEGALNG